MVMQIPKLAKVVTKVAKEHDLSLVVKLMVNSALIHASIDLEGVFAVFKSSINLKTTFIVIDSLVVTAV